MQEQVVAELIRIFRAIDIRSTTCFSFGERLISLPDPAPPPTPYPQPHPLVLLLQWQLYQYCFTQRFTQPLAGVKPLPAQTDDLVQELAAANASRERWEAGWQVHHVLSSGGILACRFNLARTFWTGEFATHEGPSAAPQVGRKVSVFVPRGSATKLPGFYVAFGETLADQQDEASLVRFYWNTNPAGATALMELLTRELNRFQVPFQFKCASYRHDYIRLDAAVLYVSKRFFRVVAELVSDIYQNVMGYLQPDTPLFTRRLAPGLALAEDPGNGESFGLNRCRILAEGVWNAYINGSQTEQARLEQVVNAFRAYGIPSERPYLNPGSIDRYELPDPPPSKST